MSTPTGCLPHTDPFGRQIVIGLGCFLETMRIAAAEAGHAVALELFPEGEDAAALDGRPRGAGAVQPGRGGNRRARKCSPRFARAVRSRSPYDTSRPVPQTDLSALVGAGAAGHDGSPTTGRETGRVEALRDLTARAFRIEFATPRTYKESVDLFRIGHREVDADPDGIDLIGADVRNLAPAPGSSPARRRWWVNSMPYRAGARHGRGPIP